ncbi:MAG: M28 family peptidase [Rhodothermales bacterium]
MRPSLFVWLGFVVLGLGSLVQWGGCQSFSVVEESSRLVPNQPVWSDDALREHLRFFNGSEVESRATGTQGFAAAGTYVAARLAEFNLQPALGGDARIVYLTPLNEIREATLNVLGADTLLFYPGVDYLPDGRSDSGHVDIPNLVIVSGAVGAESATSLPGRAVLLPARTASTENLEALRDAGARIVFTVGRLEPRPSSFPIQGLMVVQVPPRTAARFLRVPPATVATELRDPSRRSWVLPRPIRVRVETQRLPNAGALNIMAYVPGKHPQRAEELVVVCADLDAVGPFAGVRTLDADHLGTGVAALLEVARQYAFYSRYQTVPERTILFAVFSGARQGYAGLRSYLRHPLWALDHTRAFIYVGLDPSEEPLVRAVLDPFDLPLLAVSASADTLDASRVLLLPERRPPRQRTVRESGEEAEREEPPRLSALIEAGVLSAHQMVEQVTPLLFRETVSPAPLFPFLGDTLRVPRGH